MNQVGIIIQARIGSTRLFSKVILPFYKRKSIFDLLIEKLQTNFSIPIILATSEDKENDILEKVALKKGILVYRGSENDVLLRFINAAEKFNINKIIRICSDNPFLDIDELHCLVNFIGKNNYDYVSFDVEGTPSIKTHFGFWTEYVTLDALKKANNLTSLPLYHEHVTNFIYENPDKFSIHFLKPNEKVFGRNDIRMTLDTEQDFKTLSEIYKILSDKRKKLGIDEIITFLDENPAYKNTMITQIKDNSK